MNLFLASLVTAVIAIITVMSGDTSKDIPPVVLLLIGSNMVQLVLLHKDMRTRTDQLNRKIQVLADATANIFGKTVAVRDALVSSSVDSKEEFKEVTSDLEKVANRATKEMRKHIANSYRNSK